MAVPSNMYLGEQTDDQHHDIHDQLYQGSKQIDNALADHRKVIEDAGKEIGDTGANIACASRLSHSGVTKEEASRNEKHANGTDDFFVVHGFRPFQ